MTDVSRRSRAGVPRVPRALAWGVLVVLVCLALLFGVTAFAQVPGVVAAGPAPGPGALPDYLNIMVNGGVGLYAVGRLESAVREAAEIGRAVVRAIERSVEVGTDRAAELDTSLRGLPPAIERLATNISNARAA